MQEEERCPLRVEQVFCVTEQEWRPGEKLPPRLTECWQLVYVAGGMVEETADLRRVPLGAGWVCFHQPGEAYSMRVVGTVPPEVLRVEFACNGAAMDAFRNLALRTDSVEKTYLSHLVEVARQVFLPPKAPGEKARPRAEVPFAGHQQVQLHLELVLIAVARRLRGPKRASARARREKSNTALLESVRTYFAGHLGEELTVEQVCRDNGCTRARLQKVFRARTKSGAMEYFARMKVERAKELLQAGYSPGEAAAQLGYSSGGYFSRCFKKFTGQTPHGFQLENLKNERI